MSANAENVAVALHALGEAYRGDWSDFDGRTLRDELDGLSAYLLPEAPLFDINRWFVGAQICPLNLSWAENCSEQTDPGLGRCDHLRQVAASVEVAGP